MIVDNSSYPLLTIAYSTKKWVQFILFHLQQPMLQMRNASHIVSKWQMRDLEKLSLNTFALSNSIIVIK